MIGKLGDRLCRIQSAHRVEFGIRISVSNKNLDKRKGSLQKPIRTLRTYELKQVLTTAFRHVQKQFHTFTANPVIQTTNNQAVNSSVILLRNPIMHIETTTTTQVELQCGSRNHSDRTWRPNTLAEQKPSTHFTKTHKTWRQWERKREQKNRVWPGRAGDWRDERTIQRPATSRHKRHQHLAPEQWPRREKCGAAGREQFVEVEKGCGGCGNWWEAMAGGSGRESEGGFGVAMEGYLLPRAATQQWQAPKPQNSNFSSKPAKKTTPFPRRIHPPAFIQFRCSFIRADTRCRHHPETSIPASVVGISSVWGEFIYGDNDFLKLGFNLGEILCWKEEIANVGRECLWVSTRVLGYRRIPTRRI